MRGQAPHRAPSLHAPKALTSGPSQVGIPAPVVVVDRSGALAAVAGKSAATRVREVEIDPVATSSPTALTMQPFLAGVGGSSLELQRDKSVLETPAVSPTAHTRPPQMGAARSRTASAWWSPVKRILDVVIAAPLLVIFSPLIVALWIAIRATSSGPGLFWSTRVGRYGRTFSMPKLRSMRQGAPLQAREAFAVGQDPATPLGRFIRAYSLDELPQLWCVLIGQMSLIGPRPLLPDDPGALQRLQFPDALSVRPGVTGLAQVSGRNFVTPRRKARYDAFYAKRLTAKLDAAILWRTIVALFFRRGGGVM